jgi:hypothetical protein
MGNMGYVEGKLMPDINSILLAWIRAKNIKFRYVCDGGFVNKWRQDPLKS